jgi:hypothetical protein
VRERPVDGGAIASPEPDGRHHEQPALVENDWATRSMQRVRREHHGIEVHGEGS